MKNQKLEKLLTMQEETKILLAESLFLKKSYTAECRRLNFRLDDLKKEIEEVNHD